MNAQRTRTPSAIAHRLVRLLLVVVLGVSAGALLAASTPSEASAGDRPVKHKKKKAKAKAKKKKADKKADVKEARADHARVAKAAIARTGKALRHVGTEMKKLDSAKEKKSFAKAVAHQRAARKALAARRPAVAIHQTRKARALLIAAADANGIKKPSELDDVADEDTVLVEEPVAEGDGDDLVAEAEGELGTPDEILADEDFGDSE